MVSYFDVFLFTFVGSVVSLIGGLFFITNKRTARALVSYATPFAAGGLLAAVFFDLLPQGITQAKASSVLTSTLAGLLVFFYLERFLRWFHHHHEPEEDEIHVSSKTLIVIGNMLHNALDGVAIAAAFLVSFPVGAVITIAVAAHEIPREIGDFGLLLARKMSKRNVILVHILSSLGTTAVALVVFAIGGSSHLPLGVLLGISAGFMLYIATSDIIPSIHNDVLPNKLFDLRPLLLLVGVIVVGVAIMIAQHFGA